MEKTNQKQPDTQAMRERLAKLFEFLKAYTDLRYPPVRDINQQLRTLWLKDLPIHSSVELFRDTGKTDNESEDSDIVLRLTRPTTTPCPPPPPALSVWLKQGWREYRGTVEVEATRNVVTDGETRIERFEDNYQRPALLRDWQRERDLWVTNERPARHALTFFQTVYEWYGIQEREGEKIEMLVGDGLLRCQGTGGEFRHPVLLQKLELEFYPEKKQPQFVFRKRERPPELYMEFLRSLPEVNNQQLACCADELKKAEFAPLGGEDTDGFLRRLIQGLFPSRGSFIDDDEQQLSIGTGLSTKADLPLFNQSQSAAEQDSSTVQRQPVIFIRQRRSGPGSIFDAVLSDITNRIDFSPALLQILGLAESTSIQTESIAGGYGLGNEDDDILLSKPANQEQLEIAKQLARKDCVLVQGPPGTGKTHTIANLLGHLLSQGKRVLVTAHTPKALRVLREKVVEPLRPLCVSILQNDKQSQDELQASVKKINEQLSKDDRQLEREANRLREDRKRILKALRDAREKFLDARQDEIRDVVFAGKATRPIEAAKRVKANAGKDDWIPSPVTLGESMPASIAEVVALYQTNARVSAADERELNGFRPELSTLPTPKEFQSVVEELNSLEGCDLRFREELWDANLEPGDLNEFDRMLEAASKTIEFMRDSAPWQLEAIQAGRDGDEARRVWESLSELIETTWREVQECHALAIEHGPVISDSRPPHDLLQIVEEIILHNEAGKSFGLLAKLTNRHWFEFKEKVQVGSRVLDMSNLTHLLAVRASLRMRKLRSELTERWERQMACQGGPACSELSDRPEQVCKQFVTRIQTCLEWHVCTWQPLEGEIQRLGFFWSAFLESTPPETGANAELNRIRRAVLGDFGAILKSRSGWLRHKQLRAILAGWPESVPTSETPDALVSQRLRRAIREAAPSDYQAAYDELTRLKNLEIDLTRRRGLLKQINRSAPAWASAIENRHPKHDTPQPPGDPESAWEWRQLYDELERRANVSLDQLQQQIENLGSQLLEVTAQLVEKQTWMNQIRQTGSKQKQALGAYAAMRNRLTKTGKGVRDVELRAAARREMTTAKDAVPVWIMPLPEVAETFDPQKARFDVVIVDESSQCDPTSLFALYLGRQTIVVGDDEQVSPVAVGEKSEEVVKLINAYLNGVPFKELYDGSTSIYDLAQIAFGGVIRLTEHFRCAPDIIAFSNNLSYKGEIKPLREASSIPLNPHVVHFRVEGGRDRGDNVNEVEAEIIAALICAATEQPEFVKNDQGKPTTFGVVSLVAHNQALKIDGILRQRLEPAEYQRRQILCGDSAQFQGDERDVMFLSVVDAPPADPPLPMRQEGGKKIFKKRFNVAASRARNQMWIVHSLNHEVDLKVGDYRRNLIEHALDPNAWERELRKRMERTESIFEERVLRRLMEAHFNVLPQFQVGAYWIDLVVSGNGRRLAVECDGERWHGPEKLREDTERQAILERLGWKFVRIRGSLFFRDEDRALKAMFARLAELNIAPEIEITSSKPSAKAEVIERVIRRAQELQASWRANGGPYTEAMSEKEKNQMPTFSERIGDEGAPRSAPPERRVVSSADNLLNQNSSTPVKVLESTQASTSDVRPELSSLESGIVPPKDGRLQGPFNQDGKRTVDLRKCCESPLEGEMYDELTKRGFRVTPQVQVGQYRIDLVVEGRNHARLAVENDGNQYMGKDNFAHMQRQRILERAGWVFWRYSASSFIHRRKDILDDLLKTLAERGIKPIGTEGAPRSAPPERRVVSSADNLLNQNSSTPVKVLESTQASSPAVQRALLKRSENKGFITRKKEYICPLLGAKFVLIPAGTFMMGSPHGESGRCDDERQHQVTISKPFYMQTTEVTQGQWKQVMGSNPSYFKSCGDDCPVENISWNDVQEFIGKLNQMERMDKYRLPTEAQWEYAARAGTTTRFYSGDNDDGLSHAGWYSGNSRSMTHPVGQKTPNAWGLYDMHGNLWEWVYDLKGNYPSGIVTDPEGPSSGSYRMSRGGSWSDLAAFCRSAYRVSRNPGARDFTLGFRLLRTS